MFVFNISAKIIKSMENKRSVSEIGDQGSEFQPKEKKTKTEDDLLNSNKYKFQNSPLNDEEIRTEYKSQWDEIAKVHNVESYLDMKPMKAALHWLIKGVNLMERAILRGNIKEGPGDGANILLNGVRGIGKTTLMKRSREVINSICDHMIAVYWDFETMGIQEPYDAIRQALSHKSRAWLEVPNTTILEEINRNKISIIFFGYEVQELYSPGIGEKCVRQLLCIGRKEFTLGVISGSTVKIKELAFDKSRPAGFPNLNNSVYRFFELKPSRTREDLKKLLRINSKKKEFEEEYLQKMMSCSGGVTRYVIIGSKFGTTWQEHPGLWGVVHNLFREMNTNKAFRPVSFQLVTENESNQDAFAMKSLPKFQLINTIENHSRDEREYKDWIDNDLLLENEEGNVEFLFPALISELSEWISHNKSSWYAHTLEALLYGWNGEPSPGHVWEERVLTGVAENPELFLFESALRKFNRREISFANPPEKNNREILALRDLKNKDDFPNLLYGELFQMSNDRGFDGVVFEKGERYTELLPHLIQIKIGKRNMKTNLGAEYVKRKRDDRFLLGILEKAKSGAKKLKENVPSDVNLNFASFTLVTSKNVTSDAKSHREDNFDEDVVDVEVIDGNEFFELIDPAVLKAMNYKTESSEQTFS
eukprot:gb/GECH01010986.1/.p1 GENE.gb/GECH01010986.1/~~gb/GECH01010986.1/.p1  ORF type:complete len:649 (+),score=93.34 gb/GECH01010986.1/:1-1947(+)